MSARLIPPSLKLRIQELPDGPGVYLFRGSNGDPVYIGKAISIRKRVMSHFRCYGESFSKEGKLLAETRSIDFIRTATESDALLLEASLVKENQPRYNQELKDDKSYPFLKITGEEYPRLLVVRGRKADGGKYFGPYTSGRLLRQAVVMLRRLFPMRTCQPVPEKVCLMYHIGQCGGPCEGKIGREAYLEIVKELTAFLEGRRDAVVRSLLRRMKEYSAGKEYEKAKAVYEQVQALSNVRERRSRVDRSAVLEEMKRSLALPQLPTRIEGFDISNISGREAVGSMVVCLGGEATRSEYRRFRIRTVKGIDDYAMMREVIRRRYGRLLEEQAPLPDLVMIDGGKGHLAAAKSVLDEIGLSELPILSIAKQHEHIFVPGRSKPYIFPPNSAVLQLVQRLRDEAHRFAITYHRRLHKKEAVLSRLDEVPGVGPKTKERLLKRLGSVKRMLSMDPEALARQGNISLILAQKILQNLS